MDSHSSNCSLSSASSPFSWASSFQPSQEPGQPLDTVMDTLPDSVALDTTGDGRVDTIKRLVNERDQYSS